MQLGNASFEMTLVGWFLLEDSHNIRAAELEVRNVLALFHVGIDIHGEDDRRNLGHSNGQNRNNAMASAGFGLARLIIGSVDDNESTSLTPLITGVVRCSDTVSFRTVGSRLLRLVSFEVVVLPVFLDNTLLRRGIDFLVMVLQVMFPSFYFPVAKDNIPLGADGSLAILRFRLGNLKVNLFLDVLRYDYLPFHGGMLTMIIGRPKESVREAPIVKFFVKFRTDGSDQVLDGPVDTLGVDTLVGGIVIVRFDVDLPLNNVPFAVEYRISALDNDLVMVVFRKWAGMVDIFPFSRKPVIE